ncbi:hypothetical protein [Actinoallomurus rhizosphaericola]|uniref:hypothetical protein n=1 Tax=Actinoallomurus rhizosphaericola TaxID=2952536 RepID=UPI002092651A|nr:hypothetical protein [Actinoallomurus rhizosphaericola]MCO5998200.1 hypothetical protein [Actinoallomurus rhizosphaericola]
MRKRLTMGIGVTVCAAALTGLSTTAQAREAVITSVKVTPSTVVQSTTNRKTVTVQVHTSTETDHVTATLEPVKGSGFGFIVLKQTSPGWWSGSDFIYNYDAPGAWNVDIDATDYEADGPDASKTVQISVKRNISLSKFKASSTKVKKGRKFTLSGTLKRWDGSYQYVGYKGQKVTFYFKKKGAKTYAYAGSTTTGSGGKFTKKVTASKSGTWQARYAGSSIYVAAVSATAGVTVH